MRQINDCKRLLAVDAVRVMLAKHPFDGSNFRLIPKEGNIQIYS